MPIFRVRVLASFSGRGFLGLTQNGISFINGSLCNRRSPVPSHLKGTSSREVCEKVHLTKYQFASGLQICHRLSRTTYPEMCQPWTSYFQVFPDRLCMVLIRCAALVSRRWLVRASAGNSIVKQSSFRAGLPAIKCGGRLKRRVILTFEEMHLCTIYSVSTSLSRAMNRLVIWVAISD